MNARQAAVTSALIVLAGCSGGGGPASSPQMSVVQTPVATPATTSTSPSSGATFQATSNPSATPVPTASPASTATPQAPRLPVATVAPAQTPVPTSSPAAASPTPVPSASPTGVPPPSNPQTVTPGATATPNMLLDGAPYQPALAGEGWLPTSLAVAFLYPIEYGYGGAGQVAVVIGDAAASQSDLTAYSQVAGLPVSPKLTIYTYGPGNSSGGSALEAALDVQTIAGLAPYASIDDVVVPDFNSQSETDALSEAIQNLAPNVVSISFTGCESDSTQADEAIDNVTEEAAATGITVVASSGDDGPACPAGSQTLAGVGEPASDPYVVAAGGNEDLLRPPYTSRSAITTSLRNPAAWDDTDTTTGGSGGGGVSAVWPLPRYQNAPGIVSTAASSKFRNVPDIAMPASASGPTAVYVSGAWQYAYGTSWSAPAFAAMQAEIDQQCGSSRWGLPDLYRVFYQAPSSFVDVTSGEIESPNTSLTYSAGTGYDNASGLGLPLGEDIAIQDGC